MLDDDDKWPRHSSPDYADLHEAGASQVLGNRSFLCAQTAYSWHAVKAIQCPEGHMRNVFIVVANRHRSSGGASGARTPTATGWQVEFNQ